MRKLNNENNDDGNSDHDDYYHKNNKNNDDNEDDNNNDTRAKRFGWFFCICWHCVRMTSSNRNIFHVTVHLCGEWIPYTKASDAEL